MTGVLQGAEKDDAQKMFAWFEENNFIHGLRDWKDDPNCTCHWCSKDWNCT